MTETQDKPRATEARLLFLHAQTPLHPGSGTALGVVDLPVQRERHTQWPLVPGSALKGIFRDACRRAAGNDEELFAAFGPETSKAGEHAGALSVTDARILAFPVRSLHGVFAWVTCPAVLGRLARDCHLAHAAPVPLDDLKALPRNQAACLANTALAVDRGAIVLEEFQFQRCGSSEQISCWISNRAFDASDCFTPGRLKSHLVILSDDDFTHFVRHATEVVARIGLHYKRKTVKTGALFYQEFLPAETLFYAVVFANASRREGLDRKATDILKYLTDHLPNVLQVGGDETTGKGLCAVRLAEATG